MGRPPEAIAEQTQVTELDPFRPSNWKQLANPYSENGDYDAVEPALQRESELQPAADYAWSIIGQMRLLQGRNQDALEAFKKDGDAAARLWGVALAEHAMGHAGQSQQALDELVSQHAKDSPDDIADIFAWRGDKNKAFEWLERAYRERDRGLLFINTDPFMKSLKNDQRYRALLARWKLPQ